MQTSAKAEDYKGALFHGEQLMKNVLHPAKFIFTVRIFKSFHASETDPAKRRVSTKLWKYTTPLKINIFDDVKGLF